MIRRFTRGEFLSLSAILAGAAALAKVPFGKALAQRAPSTVATRNVPIVDAGGMTVVPGFIA